MLWHAQSLQQRIDFLKSFKIAVCHSNEDQMPPTRSRSLQHNLVVLIWTDGDGLPAPGANLGGRMLRGNSQNSNTALLRGRKYIILPAKAGSCMDSGSKPSHTTPLCCQVDFTCFFHISGFVLLTASLQWGYVYESSWPKSTKLSSFMFSKYGTSLSIPMVSAVEMTQGGALIQGWDACEEVKNICHLHFYTINTLGTCWKSKKKYKLPERFWTSCRCLTCSFIYITPLLNQRSG